MGPGLSGKIVVKISRKLVDKYLGTELTNIISVYRYDKISEYIVNKIYGYRVDKISGGEHGGSVVERRTPEREVGGSKPTSAVFCP